MMIYNDSVLLRAAALVGKINPLDCTPVINPRCAVDIGNTAGQGVVDGALGDVAAAIRTGIAWMVKNTVSWWIDTPSRALDHETAIASLRAWTLPVAVAVGMVGMLVTAARMTLSRKATPLIDAGAGLVTVAGAAGLGVVIPALLLRAGDAWSTWILNASTGHRFAARVTTLLTFPGAPAGVVVVLGIVGLFAAAVQAVLMLFRETALIILAGVLPLAAAGTLTPITKAWFGKVSGWMLALIFYKPVAAMVYATAFTLVGNGKDVRTVFMGFATMILSLIALPTLMKLFNWTTGSVGQSGHGGGILGAAVGGVAAVGAFRGGFGAPAESSGSAAAGQARFLAKQLGGTGRDPGSGPGSASGRGSAPGPRPSGGGSAGTAAGTGEASGPASAAATPAPATTAAAGPTGAASAGTGAAASAAGGAAGGATAAGAAAGPVGVAVAGLAMGAKKAGDLAKGATQPPRLEQ